MSGKTDDTVYILRMDRAKYYPEVRIGGLTLTKHQHKDMETTINDITYICYNRLLVPKAVCECVLLHPNGQWHDMDSLASSLNAIESVDEFTERYYGPFLRCLIRDTEKNLAQHRNAPPQAMSLVTAFRTRYAKDNEVWRKHLNEMYPPEFLKWLGIAGDFFGSLINTTDPLTCLTKTYGDCCEEYRHRLCGMWGVIPAETRWIDDRVGWELSVLHWKDPIPMDWVKWFVENNVTEREWLDYLDYCDSEIDSGKSRPSIGFYRWFDDGERPLPIDKNYD